MVLHIAVDLRPLLGNHPSGVATYTRETLLALLDLDHQNQYYLWTNATKQYRLPQILQRPNVKFFQTHIPNKLLNPAIGLLSLPHLESFFPHRPDLFWVPDPRPIALRPETKLVTTFHDLSPEHHPEFFSLQTRLWHRLLALRKLAIRSNHIIAVSEYTRHDLIENYHLAPEKITAIPEASALMPAGEDCQARIRAKYDLPEKYILTLSTLEPRKNLTRTVAAFLHAKADYGFPHKLVIAGSPNRKIFAGIPSLKNHPDVEVIGHIHEPDKCGLYSGADLFLNLSLMEGFGLPVLESISCGTPTLVSDNTALPETAGPAGLAVDPYDTAAIARSMGLLLTTSSLAKLKSATEKHSAQYSWHRTAHLTLKLFEQIAG